MPFEVGPFGIFEYWIAPLIVIAVFLRLAMAAFKASRRSYLTWCLRLFASVMITLAICGLVYGGDTLISAAPYQDLAYLLGSFGAQFLAPAALLLSLAFLLLFLTCPKRTSG
jgi:hypothetical protein